ncbi:MAG: hypothetical protein GTO63_25655, partial [Anaerolineae bacterium]|nr:hypothetical protein [Anaerolineae bacterium]NIN98117.1 hypothetical protein [Anaerolineae bacterium]
QVLDSTGQIATRYAYDPFGVPLAGNGVSNPWQFTGEAWDAEVELLYLRARYYQPERGRFITKDPWAGDVWRPSTLNAYTYVDSNPGSYIDPGGLDGWGPGGLFPEITPGAPSQGFLELFLMWSWLFPEDPLRLVFLPYQAWWEMLLYSQTGHSPMAAANLSKAIGYSWLFQ